MHRPSSATRPVVHVERVQLAARRPGTTTPSQDAIGVASESDDARPLRLVLGERARVASDRPPTSTEASADRRRSALRWLSMGLFPVRSRRGSAAGPGGGTAGASCGAGARDRAANGLSGAACRLLRRVVAGRRQAATPQHVVAARESHAYNSDIPARRRPRPCFASRPPVTHQTIVVLDFGSQYTQLIARRLRELSVYSEILPPTTPRAEIAQRKPVGHHPVRRTEERLGAGRADESIPAIFELGTPDARHLLRHAADDRRARRRRRQRAAPRVRACRRQRRPTARRCSTDVPAVAQGLGEPRRLRRRGAAGFEVVATSANAPVAAMQDPTRRLYGLLFHPEVVHTEHGEEILRNFAFGVCGCRGDWTMASFVDESVGADPRARSATGRVVCGLSGGVDSTVAAMLLHRAIGDRLTCIFVDNGLLRLERGRSRCGRASRGSELPLEFVDATDLFLERLAGRHRSREEAQDHRRGVHRRVREARAPSSASSTSSRRARCIRT